jgi:hypothetical protein
MVIAEQRPLGSFVALAVVLVLVWLVARDRLIPRRLVGSEERLAGYTAGLVVLGVLALLVVATNAYALVFLLPSLHAWLWMPHVHERGVVARFAVFAAGLAGPVLLLWSFASRAGLGRDAPWYVAVLVRVGYVNGTAVLLSLVWLSAAAQLTALGAGRYAPYPSTAERPPRGPLRELVRRAIVALRRRRAARRERRLRVAA